MANFSGACFLGQLSVIKTRRQFIDYIVVMLGIHCFLYWKKRRVNRIITSGGWYSYLIVLKWKSSLLNEAVIIEKLKRIFFSLRNDFFEKDNQQKYFFELYGVLFSPAHRLKSHLLNHLHCVSIFLLPDLSSL